MHVNMHVLTFVTCPQDRPVTFHKLLWDTVYNNPRKQVHGCVFSKVGVPLPREKWALEVGPMSLSAQAKDTSGAKRFHTTEYFVFRAMMQDGGNNLRQGVILVAVKLRGPHLVAGKSPGKRKSVDKEISSLFFDPVDLQWQTAMGLDVSKGDAGACSV